MHIPSRRRAEAYLAEAEQSNPGLWVQHARQVARVAKTLADHHPALDSEVSYIVGLLHDIGRRVGVTGMRHVIDGYHYLLSEGYPDAARICITHSFPIPFVGAGAGKWDCTFAELKVVQTLLDSIEFTLYDRLIQLCDALCLPHGPVLMEKRLVDVVLRHGVNAYTIPKWHAFLNIQREMEATIGGSIYALLPEVVNNTFQPSDTSTSNQTA